MAHIKNPPARHEMRVRFLHQEDPLEEAMATHSNILAWSIPRTKRSLEGYSPEGCKETQLSH